MTRYKAAGIHIFISVCIVLTVLTTMYFLWYPSTYFKLMGGTRLIIVLASVDIFLGPLLTLVIFKTGKKGLKFDLFCIGLVQVYALCYGVYVMFEARPIFTVFNKDKFQIAAVVDITPEELAKANNPKWKKPSITGPVLVAIGMPDKNDRKEVMFANINSSMAYRYPRLFDEYTNHRDEAIKAGKPLADLSTTSAENKRAIENFLNKTHRPKSEFLALPVSSELAKMSAIIDAKTGDFIGIIDAKATLDNPNLSKFSRN